MGLSHITVFMEVFTIPQGPTSELNQYFPSVMVFCTVGFMFLRALLLQ